MDIQNIVKSKLKQRSLTLTDLAYRMSISKVSLWRILSGKQDINVAEIKKIADVCNCDVDMKIINGQVQLKLIDRK